MATRQKSGRESRERQAKRHAEQAKRKTDKRRKDAEGGVSGWVAERAGQWSLDGPDTTWMEWQKYLWNPLMDYWFRMEIEGWDRIPEPPALLVGIHSGAPFVWDAWTVGVQWWRRFGDERPLHGTAHDAPAQIPGLRLRICGFHPVGLRVRAWPAVPYSSPLPSAWYGRATRWPQTSRPPAPRSSPCSTVPRTPT